MLRKVAGGLMCLAVIALGVALLRGQEAGKNPKPGDSGSETVPNVPAGAADEGTLPIDPNLVGFDVFAGDGAIAGGELDQNNVIVEIGDDGSAVEAARDPSGKVRAVRHIRGAAQVIDPATREALEKMVAGLKDEAKKLESEGKKEDAGAKLQSIGAIERMLTRPALDLMVGGPNAQRVYTRTRPVWRPDSDSDEMKKLGEHVQQLKAQLANVPNEDDSTRAKLQGEIARLAQQIAERQARSTVAFFGAMGHRPGRQGHREAPALGGFPGGFGPGPADAEALSLKAQALSQAAAKLQEVGLEDQSRNLSQQSEKIRAEADRIREQARAELAAGGRHGPPGGPHELVRSIRELQEQVQQLRKEVGELRELLQRR